MKQTATALEIAAATGLSKMGVIKKLNRIQALYTWENGRGGNKKNYVISSLPREYRLALAAYRAAPVPLDDTMSPAERAGAEAAMEMLKKKAREQELEAIMRDEAADAFKKLPSRQQDKARARYNFIKTADNFVRGAGFKLRGRRSKAGDMAFIRSYNSGDIKVDTDIVEFVGEKTSYSTLRRWADLYTEQGMIGLADKYHNPKKGSSRLSNEQQEFVVACMCGNPQTSSKNLRRLLQGQFGHDVPSVGVISRFCKRWIKDNMDLWLFHTNPDEWKNRSMFAFGSASDHIIRLNQMWEADSTPADLMLKDGRHSLIGMIDVFSRRLRLLVTRTSKAVSVVALIRDCIIDWGVPESVKTDNGKDYKSVHVRSTLEALQIDQIFCNPFASWEKPHIERAFRTFSHNLVEMMPNYIGHNVSERKAIEARRSFAERVMNRGGDPVEINMTSTDLQKFCNEWVNFVYHHDPHAGLDGRKPIEMVRSWDEPVRRITNMRALDMLLAPAPSKRYRRIGKEGVRVNNKKFGSMLFAGHEGKLVDVLLDPTNLGQVFVYLIHEDNSREFLCPAIDPVYYGIDPAEFATRARKHQEKLKRAEVKKLKKLVRKYGDQQALVDSYMELRASETDNIIELPPSSTEYDTPALREAGKAVISSDEAAMEQKESEIVTVSGVELDLDKVRAEVNAPLQKSEKITLIRGNVDLYLQIKDRVSEPGRKLSRKEAEWLEYFYEETESGKSFRALEGDLRRFVGIDETAQVVK